MSRANPWPRSGDRSKAVMVGVMGFLIFVSPAFDCCTQWTQHGPAFRHPVEIALPGAKDVPSGR
jgi:hypothetical protein